jgi:hypothetical protein
LSEPIPIPKPKPKDRAYRKQNRKYPITTHKCAFAFASTAGKGGIRRNFE